MDKAKLEELSAFLGGRGCVTRYGYMVYTWGDEKKRGDVASACKPVISHFLIVALERGMIPSLDEKVVRWEPRLNDINAELGYKDREITWRHLANQTSCYGVPERPGTAFDYNDYQMALFWDTLFLKVYCVTEATADDKVLRPMLTDILQCQDNPTFTPINKPDRAGRFGVSARDFCRFGLLYMMHGKWNGKQVISAEHVRMLTTSPLPLSIPRTKAERVAEMIPGQRTIGSGAKPDDQADHDGSYSWLWWINGVTRSGKRFWPDAPVDTFLAWGHDNAKRSVVVIPSLGIVASWNDTTLADRKGNPLNEALKMLSDGAKPAAP